MTSSAIVGSTGLVGSHILNTLLAHPSISAVHALSRREPRLSTPNPHLHALISLDSSTWSSLLSSIPSESSPSLFFSALGTTRAQAGTIEAQRKIDYDLNLELVTTFSSFSSQQHEKKKIYILISTSGANAASSFPYMRMKGELEEAVKPLADAGTQVILLRPGLIVGDREDSRPAEWVVRKVAGCMGGVNAGLMDFWAQDAGVIGRAAVSAGLRAMKGRDGEAGEVIPKVWVLGQADIVRLGRTEWKEV
ncbi:putative protein fmp52, mitochondrial [Sclerotinia borealis F-4128]|uniref:NAD(P)-binding domain-containing protein n=1 Tax=Sclerotinia borealis (strain F-4128) TaxID=1432307 RepID=W9CEQ5_SCLBF|nr:putative protein fmp52, mitochondrial [Sclerotinia borealis F-4128]